MKSSKALRLSDSLGLYETRNFSYFTLGERQDGIDVVVVVEGGLWLGDQLEA
jgi:hypothetical protein